MILGIILGLAGLYAAFRIGNAVVGVVAMAVPLLILAGAWLGGGPTSVVSTLAILGGTTLVGWLFRSAGACFLYSTVTSGPLWYWTLNYTEDRVDGDVAVYVGFYALFFVPLLWILSMPLSAYFQDLPRVSRPADRSAEGRQRAFSKTGFLITKEGGEYIVYRTEEDRAAGRRLLSGTDRIRVMVDAVGARRDR